VSVEHGIRFLPSVAALVLQGLGQHRLLTTHQVQVLHLADVSLRYTQRVLAELQRLGLADRVHAAHGAALWFATAEGRLLLRAKSRLEAQGDHNAPWQTNGMLRSHTLALNDAGIAFVKAARARGDECDAFSWRHEIAHPLTPPRQGREQQWLVADALLSYLEVRDGESVLRQRFIELNLATTSAERLAAKLARYKLQGDLRAGGRAHRARLALALPHVPAGPRRPRRPRPAEARRRIRHLISIGRSDPATQGLDAIPLHFVTLQQLTRHGPHAPIFITAKEPEQDRDWLGRAQGAI
jgi:Replication-relaxation